MSGHGQTEDRGSRAAAQDAGVDADDAEKAARRRERAIRRQIAALRPPRLAGGERGKRAAPVAKTGAESPAESLPERRIPITPAAPKAERQPPLPIAPVYQDDALVVSQMGDPEMPRVVLCFAGIGRPGKEQPRAATAVGGVQVAEFVGSAQLENSSVLHIADVRRSWFNGFEAERLLGVLHPLIAGKRLVSLGNSMGGFGAIWITKYLPVELALAFVPQFSVHPGIVPRERRWREYTSRITDWRAESLADCFVPGTRYYTFNSDRDFLHWRHFRPAANIDHFVLRDGGHEAAAKIKAAGVLGTVIRACADGDDPFPVMKKAGLDVHKLGA